MAFDEYRGHLLCRGRPWSERAHKQNRGEAYDGDGSNCHQLKRGIERDGIQRSTSCTYGPEDIGSDSSLHTPSAHRSSVPAFLLLIPPRSRRIFSRHAVASSSCRFTLNPSSIHTLDVRASQ